MFIDCSLIVLEIANLSNLTIVFYPLGIFGQVLCIRSCHKDLILTRKSHNYAGIAFIQGDSAGGSKLIEQTLQTKENNILFAEDDNLSTFWLKKNMKEMIT